MTPYIKPIIIVIGVLIFSLTEALMRKILVTLILLLIVCPFIMPPVFADEPKARGIMQKVEDRYDGDHRTSDMLMILIDKKDNKRKKYFKIFSKDYGKDNKQIMFIEKPSNIRNTGFLTFDYDDPDKDDDQWLYLPALCKTKRVASTDKSGSFMGSDLNYSDMTSRQLSNYNYKLLKETTLNGVKVWIIESLPRSEKVINETGYKKSIIAVRQDNYVVSKIKSWIMNSNFVKIIDFKKIKLIENVWVPLEILVTKKKANTIAHKTHIKITNVKFNQNLSDGIFTLRRIEKGL